MGGAVARPALRLPSTGPAPIPFDTAVAAVLGYARGRRPIRFRTPGNPAGSWVHVPAFGYERFDTQPAADAVDGDVLVAESLHGRLHPTTWSSVRASLDRARQPAEAAVARAAGRAFWELPAEELSVLGEPGTVGAALREIGELPHPEYVTAALHHRRPRLFPHLQRTTRLQLLPHMVEGDSSLAAVVHRELQSERTSFGMLEDEVADLLGRRLTRLRLHDVLLWLSASLRLAHAVQLGRDTDEWARHPSS